MCPFEWMGRQRRLADKADRRVDMIKKKGSKFEVRTADGRKLLGTHGTRAEAAAQLRAIEAAKARRKRGK